MTGDISWSASGARPNVLLILADDMGYADIGCYGSEIRTPNLDRLAAGGLRFSQACNCARCCPTRASLLTGLYPHQAGVGHMVDDKGHRGYQGYLRHDCVTLGEVLGEAGYLTGLAGKWHVGGLFRRVPEARDTWDLNDPRRPLPTHRGFQRFFGNPAGGGSYFNVMPLIDQDRIIEVPEGFYTTDNYTDAALRMIGEAREAGRPFFVHLCYNAPHWPLHAWPEDIARYRGAYMQGWDVLRCSRHEQLKGLGILSREWAISPRDENSRPWESVADKEWEDARMAVYAAQIDRMDRNIGRIVDCLERTGVLADTLILFLSDNGGCAEFLKENGRRESEPPFTRDGRPVITGNIPGLMPGGPETFMSYDLPWANASNSPFRLFKHWVHEGGIATPLIAHWPRRVAPGGICHEPLHVCDVAATIIEVAGAKYPREHRGHAIQELEGESFAAVLAGRRWRRCRPVFWEHEGNRAVRQGPWKLVSRHPGPWELYDMDRDRTELRDLAGRNAAKARELARLYEDYARRCDVLPWEEVRRRRGERARGG
jgi:arylsulfatase A-like enzyme